MKTGLSSEETKESMRAEVQRGLKKGTTKGLVGTIAHSPRNASGESGGGCGLAELGTLGDRGQEQQLLQPSSSESRVTRQGATSSLAQKCLAQRILHPSTSLWLTH